MEIDLKKLAELKKELENKKQLLEKELELVNINLMIINKTLAESSFVTADVLLEKKEIIEEKKEVKEVKKTEKILSENGFILAEIISYNSSIEIIPNIKFTEDIAPFKSFLIKRVFDSKKNKDIETKKEKPFDYEIIKDDVGNISKIILKNISYDTPDFKNLFKSLRWTLERIREKLEK